jgi:hypothetical protein
MAHVVVFRKIIYASNIELAFLDSRKSAVWVWRGPSLTSSSTLSTSTPTCSTSFHTAISTRKPISHGDKYTSAI